MEQTKKPSYWFDGSGFSVGLMALVAFRWGAELTRSWGYAPARGAGLAINFGLVAGMVLLALLVDVGLQRAGLSRAIRSGVWFAALTGPYAGMIALHEWGHLVGSQAIGVASTLLAFLLGYWLEQRVTRKE